MDKRKKLSPEQKAEIVRLFQEGKKQAELSRLYNVSQVMIYYVINPEKQLENAKKADRSTEEYKEKNRLRVKAFRKLNHLKR